MSAIGTKQTSNAAVSANWEGTMREWLFVLAPVALVIYFVMYPAQFHGLVGWIMSMVR
jgi:hypothetical protein